MGLAVSCKGDWRIQQVQAERIVKWDVDAAIMVLYDGHSYEPLKDR